MTIRIIETNTVDEGWVARVCDGDEALGLIRQNPRTGWFRYFSGMQDRDISLERESLLALKQALMRSRSQPSRTAA
ncbi:MAG TPA: hypothetical protein VFB32_16965 [Rudaea sp.]|nr:hypothetical protein [Rudaea sp.]